MGMVNDQVIQPNIPSARLGTEARQSLAVELAFLPHVSSGTIVNCLIHISHRIQHQGYRLSASTDSP